MKKTLYEKLTGIEQINESLKNEASKLNEFLNLKDYEVYKHIVDSIPQVDIIKTQQSLMEEYEKNPVFYDAIQKRLTIEESLMELSKINKGIRKFLPRMKNKTHNERLKQIGRLISEPAYLEASGILTPDNIITTGIESSIIISGLFGFSFLFLKDFLPSDISSEMYRQLSNFVDTYTFLTVPILSLVMNASRFKSLPINEAEYLDEKIKEFYR